ncbi:MAG: quinol dehydrogenase membrane component [Candidatus Methanofastidiosum methylothiophilum]|uniref:Quinol dehydrogenase membrane component n=1 Tax=Candidatus Methanofastidiosum methylothiophilum TaxID=1705564 RepID=A0A150ITH4_9EURY|nr:MAG: quinol dehydrogenase membrane component [Candidatus Methanofastidiosum methylthiophilus]KYC48178.1 MAG: quinol dehydrogenase membrane component [Candidatus Methanofastidiosum methylthiophilus]KYC50833.1 MAG: quinol dehydrogenase membrane component [Candidatus Methanofastidiosum methylthiophilus]
MGINLEYLFIWTYNGYFSDDMKKTLVFLLTFLIINTIGFNFIYSWDDCPFGEKDSSCVYPGDCGKYIDTNNNRICDRSEPSPLTNQKETPTVPIELNLPEIKGSTIKTMTLEEVAKAYSIDTQDLMESLRINVSPKTKVESLRPYGITNSMVKEKAEALFIESNKRRYGENAVINSTHQLESIESKNSLEKILKEDLLVTFGLMILGILYFFRFKRKEIRYFALGISLVYLGFIRGGCLCVVGSLQQLSLYLIGAIKGNYLYWLMLFFLPLGVTILFGRIFCGYACPIGAWQQFLNDIGTKLTKFRMPHKLDKILKYFKYLFALVIVGVVFYSRYPFFQKIDPFSYLFGFNFTLYGIISIAIVSGTSLLISRPFCRYICPYGAVLAIFSKFSIYKIKMKNGCKKCTLCDRVCETDAIANGNLDQAECIRCKKCIDSCKFGILK